MSAVDAALRELRDRCLFRGKVAHRMPRPGDVAVGHVVVHNHVRPTRQIGMRGFRIWQQKLADHPQIELCPCNWAPELGQHYRVVGVHHWPLGKR